MLETLKPEEWDVLRYELTAPSRGEPAGLARVVNHLRHLAQPKQPAVW
jgi:hypothetical protein